jgi:hypothetical protein
MQYSEEYKMEKCQSSIARDTTDEIEDILDNVIEERTEEEDSSMNQTPSAINPMEVSNYQDELNNFILSRTTANHHGHQA